MTENLDEHLLQKRNERIEDLEHQVEALRVENQVWREMVATIRDAAVKHAPVIAHLGELEQVRAFMRNEAALGNEVQRRMRAARAEPEPEPEPGPLVEEG